MGLFHINVGLGNDRGQGGNIGYAIEGKQGQEGKSTGEKDSRLGCKEVGGAIARLWELKKSEQRQKRRDGDGVETSSLVQVVVFPLVLSGWPLRLLLVPLNGLDRELC